MSKYFIANIGSASKKYALFDDAQAILSLHFEHVGGSYQVTISDDEGLHSTPIDEAEFVRSLARSLIEITSRALISGPDDITAIGLRIVAPGTFFQEHKKIDTTYIAKLEQLRTEEPLHIGPILTELHAITARFPETPVFGLSDSAFHAQLPEHARSYAIDKETSREFDVARFGYHGFSFASAMQNLQRLGSHSEKVIICHLGSGVSIAAVKDGACIDTSMGFSPLEGLVMATRAGDIDAGALMHIARGKNLTLDELEQYLYTECGLLGLSGKTGDVRALLELESSGDAGAVLALDTFVYRIRKFIGAYAAILGGVDTLVLTGTIGERSSVIRERICVGLDFLGISLDTDKNSGAMPVNGILEIGAARTRVLAMRSDEMGEMAKAVDTLSHS